MGDTRADIPGRGDSLGQSTVKNMALSGNREVIEDDLHIGWYGGGYEITQYEGPYNMLRVSAFSSVIIFHGVLRVPQVAHMIFWYFLHLRNLLHFNSYIHQKKLTLLTCDFYGYYKVPFNKSISSKLKVKMICM